MFTLNDLIEQFKNSRFPAEEEWAISWKSDTHFRANGRTSPAATAASTKFFFAWVAPWNRGGRGTWFINYLPTRKTVWCAKGVLDVERRKKEKRGKEKKHAESPRNPRTSMKGVSKGRSTEFGKSRIYIANEGNT